MKKLSNLFLVAMLIIASPVITTEAFAGCRSRCSPCGSHGGGGGMMRSGGMVRVQGGYYGGYRPRYMGGCTTCFRCTRFTGTNLQFRFGQPVRNALRVPARIGVRAAGAVRGAFIGAFPGLFF